MMTSESELAVPLFLKSYSKKRCRLQGLHASMVLQCYISENFEFCEITLGKVGHLSFSVFWLSRSRKMGVRLCDKEAV